MDSRSHKTEEEDDWTGSELQEHEPGEDSVSAMVRISTIQKNNNTA